ncbi:MAG: protein-disulfide isomerase [Desulfuromonas sp.]|nr:MAG: protein-disulfide isomerase [Desulfuromonas sp.]
MKMKMSFVVLATLCMATLAWGFGEAGCGAGSCRDCHRLDMDEAKSLLGGFGEGIGAIEEAEVPGLWLVEVQKQGKIFPVFVDFSKQYLITGDVMRLEDRQNVTRKAYFERNPVDIGRIPLKDALLLGKQDAKTKVIVFTDPECPYCKKLHAELNKVVAERPDIAFLIKLFPLKMHPNAYPKSKSIVCSKSLQMLEDSFAGKPVPTLPCEAPEVDETIRLAGELGISSTPTMILPDGHLRPGFRTAEKIIELLDGKP